MRQRMFVGASAGILSAVALTLGAVGAAGAESGAPAEPEQAQKAAASDGPSARWTCSDSYSDKDHSTYPKPFDGATNVRSGPSTDCPVVGVAGSVNKADYHCWVYGDGHTWTYLRFKNDYYGFVHDDLLDDGSGSHGSDVQC